MRPKTATIAANIPAFLSKLWKIVNDPDTDHLISWSSDGRSFIIQNQAQFWYNLLPIYYKHNNMSSFIRQLNMYGFHKISSESGGVECDRDELKFYHPFFLQEQPTLMKLIKRKMASTKTPSNSDEKVSTANVDQISKVLVDVKQLRGRQESVDNELAAMKQENAALWQELALLRQKHMKQQQIVNKLIHFLVHIVNPNRGGLGGLGVKRRYPLMINDARHPKSPKIDGTTTTTTTTTAGSDGPTIHELETESALTDSLLSNKNKQKNETPLIDENLLNIPIIDSPETLNSDMLLTDDNDACTSSNIVDFPLKESDLQGELLQAANEYIDINNLEDEEVQKSPARNILNPNMRDAMISNLVSGTKPPTEPVARPKETTVPKKIESPVNTVKLNSANGIFRDDLDNHLESTQGELESIKDMLFDGYSLDPNALLGNQNQSNIRFDGIPFQLFSQDGDFHLDVPPLTTLSDKNANNETSSNNYDPMMSGSELMSYTNTNPPFELDFENLFEEEQIPDTTNDGCNDDFVNIPSGGDQSQLTTPIIIKKEPPTFPTSTSLSSAKRLNFK